MHPYLQSTKLPIQKMRRRRNLDGALAPRRRERPRGRTGVIPVGVMRLIRSAPAHARATEYPLRLTDFRHASPACDRTYNRSRAARRVGSRPLKRICWPGATTHLSGGLRGTVCRTVRRWIAQRVPLTMVADVALVVPVLASQEIHRPPALRASLPDPMED